MKKNCMKVCSCKYDWVNNFFEGLASVKLNLKWGFIDKTGREICPLKYDYTSEFYGGLAAVNLNGKWGVINCQGIEVIPLIFNDLWAFNFVNVVKLDNKYGLINRDGEYILPCQYDTITVLDERIIAIKSNTNYEFNLSGELLNIRNIEDSGFYWFF